MVQFISLRGYSTPPVLNVPAYHFPSLTPLSFSRSMCVCGGNTVVYGRQEVFAGVCVFMLPVCTLFVQVCISLCICLYEFFHVAM